MSTTSVLKNDFPGFIFVKAFLLSDIFIIPLLFEADCLEKMDLPWISDDGLYDILNITLLSFLV